jgi:hypothetical protein
MHVRLRVLCKTRYLPLYPRSPPVLYRWEPGLGTTRVQDRWGRASAVARVGRGSCQTGPPPVQDRWGGPAVVAKPGFHRCRTGGGAPVRCGTGTKTGSNQLALTRTNGTARSEVGKRGGSWKCKVQGAKCKVQSDGVGTWSVVSRDSCDSQLCTTVSVFRVLCALSQPRQMLPSSHYPQSSHRLPHRTLPPSFLIATFAFNASSG